MQGTSRPFSEKIKMFFFFCLEEVQSHVLKFKIAI